MPGRIPNPLWLYRIVHIQNVGRILQHGMYTRRHPKSDPDYIHIGDGPLIEKRTDYPVPTASGGMLGDYVPFYFGPLSPMLLNIKTGHRGIVQRPQRDIVYLAVKFDSIKNQGLDWCFTDGHATNRITSFFADEQDFDEVDWDVVFSQYWKNTDEDMDRMRRKQAEFLVKEHVPADCIEAIVVYDQAAQTQVQNLVNSAGLNIRVAVAQKNRFYYP
jgi:hypothetical protein